MSTQEQEHHRDRGAANKQPQWHSDNPARLQEEINLVQTEFPNFEFGYDKAGNASWSGILGLDREQFGDSPLNEVEFRVTCPPNYPKTVPIVTSSSNELKNGHVENDRRICTENLCVRREYTYQGSKRIKDTITDLQIFLEDSWLFHNSEGAHTFGQPHGYLAFIKYELEVGAYNIEQQCLCGRSDTPYRDHCYPKVKMLIDGWSSELKRKQKGYEKCDCGSGKTARKCSMKNRCLVSHYADKKHTLRSHFIRRMKEEIAKQNLGDKQKFFN